jgi:hypothetical protein
MSTAIEKVQESQLPAEMLAYAQIIERAASNPDVDVAKLEKLMDMQERVMNRRAEMAFNSAFAQMQAELPEINEMGKIVVDGKVRSKYALFEDIDKAVKPVLQKHGFAVTFKVHSDKEGINVTGILMHREGHREMTDLTLQADTSGSKNGVQSVGSSVQYGKRYVLSALLNIATRGLDDDGKKAGTKMITETQAADLIALAEEVKADVSKFCAYYKIDKIDNLPASLYASAVKAFEKKRRAA